MRTLLFCVCCLVMTYTASAQVTPTPTEGKKSLPELVSMDQEQKQDLVFDRRKTRALP